MGWGISTDLGDWQRVRKSGYYSPGARKDQLRKRSYQKPRHPKPRRYRGYCELHAASSFSFLRGASLPEDLVERAAQLELPAVALLDRGGVYGAPRFFKSAREAGIKPLVGAEVVLESDETSTRGSEPTNDETRIALLVESQTGYKNLCRLISAGALAHPKGEARVAWEQVEQHADGLHCLVGAEPDPVSHALASGGLDAARRTLERIVGIFGGPRQKRVHVEVQRHGVRAEEHRNRALSGLAKRLGLPLLATGGIRHARARDKPLFDVMTCIREHTQLDQAGSLLLETRERHLHSARDMATLFADLPRAVEHSVELADRLDFTLENLGYRFPDYPLPPGETAMSYLRKLTWNGARSRFRPLTAKAQAQLEHELNLIEKLDLAGYFLIVWDIVRFCIENRILAQGRGSAANSAVCYALRITAVDPVKMDLLFERFLSEERGEWPDIDLDLPSGDQREKVIQYVYQRYGVHGSAMTANVITYRDRMAAREVAKTLGYSSEQVDKLAKRLGSWHYDIKRGDDHSLNEEVRSLGFDPDDGRMQLFLEMWRRMQNHPRHLGQHSGGMVMCAGRLDEVVPLEPAAMENRVIVQWDKDDCADLGIIKVDLLGLGMLNALEEAVPLITLQP